jgi:hypothetical protein
MGKRLMKRVSQMKVAANLSAVVLAQLLVRFLALRLPEMALGQKPQ